MSTTRQIAEGGQVLRWVGLALVIALIMLHVFGPREIDAMVLVAAFAAIGAVCGLDSVGRGLGAIGYGARHIGSGTPTTRDLRLGRGATSPQVDADLDAPEGA